MNKIVLLIVMLLLMSGFVVTDDPPGIIIPDDPYIDVFVCDCMEPVDNIELCYCAREGTVCGNYCEYFYWTKWEEVESYWYMCKGWGMHIPMILQGEVDRTIIDEIVES